MKTSSLQYQPADPRARRNALSLLCGFAVLGAVAVVAVERKLAELQEFAAIDPPGALEMLRAWMPALALLLTAPLLAVVFFGYWIAYRTSACRRFPPPGMPVVRPTPILEGERARRRALLLSFLTTAILAIALAVPVLLMRIVASIAVGR